MEDIKTGDISKLEYIHHLASGYKAFFTWTAHEGIEQVRQSCGGAGFAFNSGIPIIAQEYSPNVTFEGDNTLMA